MTDSHDPERRDDPPDGGEDNRDDAPSGPPTITGTFRRVRRGPSIRFQKAKEPTAEEPAVDPPPAEPRPARVAIMLALAHKLQRMLDEGQVSSQAEIARMLGVTPARVTQILDLTLLPTDIQESVLTLRVPSGREPVTERHLRQLFESLTWDVQRALWAALQAGAG